MKVFILVIGVFSSFISFGQNEMKLYGDIQGGIGMTVLGKGMFHGTGGFNAVLPNNMYLRLGSDFAFGGSNKVASQLVSYNHYSLRLGLFNSISDKFSITPYFGFGYVMGVVTTSRLDTDAMALALATSLGSGVLNGEPPSVENLYIEEAFTSFSLPIGVDFNFKGKKMGVTTGFYYMISQYQEIGMRIGLTFGKL